MGSVPGLYISMTEADCKAPPISDIKGSALKGCTGIETFSNIISYTFVLRPSSEVTVTVVVR